MVCRNFAITKPVVFSSKLSERENKCEITENHLTTYSPAFVHLFCMCAALSICEVFFHEKIMNVFHVFIHTDVKTLLAYLLLSYFICTDVKKNYLLVYSSYLVCFQNHRSDHSETLFACSIMEELVEMYKYKLFMFSEKFSIILPHSTLFFSFSAICIYAVVFNY